MASEQVGRILIGMLLPGVGSAVTKETRRARLQMTQMTFALAAHRAKAGRYPKSLNDLVPEPYAKLPHDPFGGGPFRYQLAATAICCTA